MGFLTKNTEEEYANVGNVDFQATEDQITNGDVKPDSEAKPSARVADTDTEAKVSADDSKAVTDTETKVDAESKPSNVRADTKSKPEVQYDDEKPSYTVTPNTNSSSTVREVITNFLDSMEHGISNLKNAVFSADFLSSTEKDELVELLNEVSQRQEALADRYTFIVSHLNLTGTSIDDFVDVLNNLEEHLDDRYDRLAGR